MTLETVQGMEYSQHLAAWKAAFQQVYGAEPAQPERPAAQEPVGLSATVPEGTANPYAAVLSGLQSLLDGPLFKPQQGKAARVDPSPAAAVEPAEEADALEGEGEEQDEVEAAAASSGVSPSGRSTGSARRPRKRQASQQAEASAAAEEEPMAAAASPTGRQPAAKKRRNVSSATATPVGLPPPATSSLNDLATLAAAVAEEPYGDDPILADQEQLQDQGMLAFAAGGGAAAGVLGSQAEMAAGSARTARGASRAGRQRTPAPSSSGADEGDSLGLSFPLVNEDGKPLTKQQIKRLRRQQSNRESARRSRQRKAEEANMLAQRLGEVEVHCGTLQAKNNALMGELQQLRAIIDSIGNDTSALAAQVKELGGTIPENIAENISWLARARGGPGYSGQGGTGDNTSMPAELAA